MTTDNRFPYCVYGGQQESGAIGIASRGNGGQISLRDWTGVGADEYAYVAPDPLDPNIVFGGRVQRFDKRTGQSQNVAPEALRSGRFRILRTMPLLFHPADPRMLLFATNVLWRTTTGGQQWEIISPDLSRERPAVPESVGDFRTPDLETMPRRGVIYAVGRSGSALLETMLDLNRRQGTTFIFSTHDPMVMRHARRIVRLKDGKIVEDQTQ